MNMRAFFLNNPNISMTSSLPYIVDYAATYVNVNGDVDTIRVSINDKVVTTSRDLAPLDSASDEFPTFSEALSFFNTILRLAANTAGDNHGQ